jgi:hypothetical protein
MMFSPNENEIVEGRKTFFFFKYTTIWVPLLETTDNTSDRSGGRQGSLLILYTLEVFVFPVH